MATAEKSKKKGKEVTLKVEETEIPLDHFTVYDPIHGERYFVRNGDGYREATKEPVTPIRINEDRNYKMNDAESFVSYVQRYGKDKDGIIFYNERGLRMFFEEASRKESVALSYNLSLEMQAFLSSGDTKHFTQKEFFKVLEAFQDCLGEEARTLLPSVERLRLDSHIEFESDINAHDIVCIFKDKAGPQTTSIPKTLRLTLPYFEGSKLSVEIMTDLEIVKPKNVDEQPYFVLTDPKAIRTHRKAAAAETSLIKESLDKWMFVDGIYNTNRHDL